MARLIKANNVDPLVDSPQAAVPDSDLGSHLRMYNTFVHLVKWFIVHVAILVTGLYTWVIAGNATLGIFLIMVAFAALAYGIVRLSTVPRDVADPTEPNSPPSQAVHA